MAEKVIVAIEYGWEYHNLVGVFGSEAEAKEKISKDYPEIEWEKGESFGAYATVATGGIRVSDAHGEGTHLDDPMIALCEVEMGVVYPLTTEL